MQGRWGPSARLAWVRCVLKTSTDVCGGSQLSKTAVNTFPSSTYFDLWANVMDAQFMLHVNNIIKSRKVEVKDEKGRKKASKVSYQYRIDALGERQLVSCLVLLMCTSPDSKKEFREENPSIKSADGGQILSGSTSSHRNNINNNQNAEASRGALRMKLGITDWSDSQLKSFVSCTVRGFLRSDLYTSMSEFLARAEGSFGLQVLLLLPSLLLYTSHPYSPPHNLTLLLTPLLSTPYHSFPSSTPPPPSSLSEILPSLSLSFVYSPDPSFIPSSYPNGPVFDLNPCV